MIQAIKRFTFEAAHYLEGYNGPCKHMHGHSYKLEIGVAPKCADTLVGDMIIDFKYLKSIVDENIIDVWDHQVISIGGYRPTAERMVKEIVKILSRVFQETTQVKLVLVDLWETEDSHCRWTA